MTLMEEGEVPTYMPDAAQALYEIRTCAMSPESHMTGEGFALALRTFLAAHDADLIDQTLATLVTHESRYGNAITVADIQAFADRRRVGL
jgi:hypothetical protein